MALRTDNVLLEQELGRIDEQIKAKSKELADLRSRYSLRKTKSTSSRQAEEEAVKQEPSTPPSQKNTTSSNNQNSSSKRNFLNPSNNNNNKSSGNKIKKTESEYEQILEESFTTLSDVHRDSKQQQKSNRSEVVVIDTKLCSQAIAQVIKKQTTSRSNIAKDIVKSDYQTLNQLLTIPKPWEEMDNNYKAMYGRLLDWAVKTNNKLNNTSRSTAIGGAGKSQKMDVSIREARVDTKSLAEKIKRLMVREYLDRAVLASRYLHVNVGLFDQLVNRPKDWNECSPAEQCTYSDMFKFVNDEASISRIRQQSSIAPSPGRAPNASLPPKSPRSKPN